MEEYKIGEVFQLGEMKLKCVESFGEFLCKRCIFANFKEESCEDISLFVGECFHSYRSDDKNVIFIEVEEENVNEQINTDKEPTTQKCDKCGGRTALMVGDYTYCPDDEPYTNGVQEESIAEDGEVKLSCYKCDSCGNLQDFSLT